MTNPVPQILAAQTGPFSQNRTGVIASVNDDNVIVVVGGTSFVAQALDTGETLAEGDLVSVLQQNASWFILGRIIGQGENQVLDSSFEEGTPGSFPDDWEFYDVTGISSAAVVARDGAPGGNQTLAVTSADAATAVSIAYSAPISVIPGDTWNLAAYVGADYGLAATTDADADLMALWFSNATNLYPTTSAADTVVASLTDVAQLPPFTGISGSVTVPAGAAVMRVGLRSSLVTGQVLEWDLVTARKTGVPSGGTGLVDYTSITANTAGVAGTFTIGITSDPMTFRSGRAYQVRVKGFVQSSIGGDTVRILVRKTGLAGQGLVDSFNGLTINGVNGMTFFNLINVVRVPPTTAPITDVIVATYRRESGTGSAFIGASTSNPAYIEVYDVGEYADFPGANTLV